MNSIDVDLQMARDTFEKLTKKEWISYMVIVNIYLKNRAIEFPYENQYDCRLILLETEWGGRASVHFVVAIFQTLY